MRDFTFYVAGASAEMARCKRAMRALEDLGLRNELDWCAEIERVGGPSPAPGDPQRHASAVADQRAARVATIFWLLAPPRDLLTTGAWVELGIRLENDRAMPGHYTSVRKTMVSGDSARCIFASLAQEFPSDEEALAHIRAWVR